MLKNKKIIIYIFSTLFIVAIIVLTTFLISKNNSIETLSKYGSRGNEVTQIQTKLKRWGYYTGSVDRNLWK